MGPKKQKDGEGGEGDSKHKPKSKDPTEATEQPLPGKKKKKAQTEDEAEEKPAAKRSKAPKPSIPYRRPDFGETVYAVQYAISNRSTCKVCDEKIDQGEIRLGLISSGEGDYDLTAWRHLKCHTELLVVSEAETLTAASQLEGFCDIAADDQQKLVAWFSTLQPPSAIDAKERESAKQASRSPAAKDKPGETDAEEPKLGTYIDCPFKERNAALELGAKMDTVLKRWYVPFTKDLTPFSKWFPEGEDAQALIEAHAAVSAGGASASGLAAGEEAADAMEEEAIDPSKLKLPDLKRELESRGCEVSGKKAELVERLSNALAQEAVERAARVGKAGQGVDRLVPSRAAYCVHKPYDVKLVMSTIENNFNFNKFYIIQVLQHTNGGFAVWNKWGRVGEDGEGKLYPCDDEASAIKRFEDKFTDKTRNTWEAYVAGTFVKHEMKYGVVETEEGEGNELGAAPLGKLTEAQINKGQDVLARLKELLLAGGVQKETIAALSSEYYSVIPTGSAGRQAPPPLSSIEMVEAKEGQLEFWLRMGFEETKSLAANPLVGMWSREVPKSLKAACAAHGISDAKSISSSVSRGKTLHKKHAGHPIGPMDPEKYGSIVLYTGNSIYRQLNKALREDHMSVAKYIDYLRLFFEAIGCMPQQSTRLWRGIAADLFDQYEVGKQITWWSVSSCTSDEKVARDFMSQLGGDATLITLDAKSALDIAPLSVYANEKESLLAPGTMLRVVSRNRDGKVAHIHLEEVGTALESRP